MMFLGMMNTFPIIRKKIDLVKYCYQFRVEKIELYY